MAAPASSSLAVRLQQLREKHGELVRPRMGKQLVQLPGGAMRELEARIIPTVKVQLDMPASKHARVIGYPIKPSGSPVLLGEFKDADFDALKKQVHESELSWEGFIDQVINGG